MTAPNPPMLPEPATGKESLTVAAYLVTGLRSGESSVCFEDERGDYGDEDHTPVFSELTPKADAEEALGALRAEVAALRVVLVNARQALEEANDAQSGGPIQDTIWMPANVSMAETLFDYLDVAIDASREALQPGEETR